MQQMQRKKPQLSAKYPFRKNQEKLANIAIFEKMEILGSFSVFFQKRYFAES